MIKQIDGYPVGYFSLDQCDIKSLQEHYLDDILDYTESDNIISPEASISCNRNSDEMSDDFFDKLHLKTQKYFTEYLSWFNFNFSYRTTIKSWYNVHEEHDHQPLHNHITHDNPAFSSVLILKQPNDKSGQLAMRNPNLSNHLKSLDLDPYDDFPNIDTPIMKDGVFIVFPSTLEHYVMYNQTKEKRVVMASNFFIKRT